MRPVHHQSPRCPVLKASAASSVRVVRAATGVLSLLAVPLFTLPAQRVLGTGADAIVLPRGVVRVGVGGQIDTWNSTFGSDASGAPLSTAEPLGARFSSDDLGAAQVGGLSQLETRLRALTGLNALKLSLGDVQLRAEARRSTIPVRFELGVGRRLQLSAMIPYVQTRVEMAAAANPTGERGNVGLNPALVDQSKLAGNATLVSQLRASAEALDAALAACGTAPESPACSDPGAARATNAAARAFASEIVAVYGLPDEGGAAVVPRTGSETARAVADRIAALRESYGTFGVDGIGADVGPSNASQPLTGATLGTALAALGVAQPGNSASYGIGDIELGARVLLFDGFDGDMERATNPSRFTARASLDGLVRLGTGKPANAEELLSIGTGDGQMDVEVGAVADLIFGRRFWTSIAVRYGIQMAGEQSIRLPQSAEESYVGDENITLVRRDPGDYLQLELTPRVSLGDFVSLSGSYRFRSQGVDALELISGEADVIPQSIDLMARRGEGTEHRVGIGVTVSTISAYAAGRVRMPLDISYVHSRSVAGSGIGTVKLTRDEVLLRIYLSAFGR